MFYEPQLGVEVLERTFIEMHGYLEIFNKLEENYINLLRTNLRDFDTKNG